MTETNFLCYVHITLTGYSNPAIMEQVYVKEEDPAPIVLQFDHPLSEV